MAPHDLEGGHVGRAGDDDAVAGLDEDAAGKIECALGAIGDQDVFAAAGHAVRAGEGGDCVAEIVKPHQGAVLETLARPIARGLHGFAHHVGQERRVGEAAAEHDGAGRVIVDGLAQHFRAPGISIGGHGVIPLIDSRDSRQVRSALSAFR